MLLSIAYIFAPIALGAAMITIAYTFSGLMADAVLALVRSLQK